MSYQLRMHRQISDRLTGLRGTEPELARLIGQAVLALLDAGESLGPPLVVPLGSVLQPPPDPREALDYSYQRQLEMLTKVRRGVADVATSRKRVELQVSNLEEQSATLAGRRQHALDAGQADQAREAQARGAAIQEYLTELRRHFLRLTDQEDKLTETSQHLQAKVEAFRVQKETLKATYTAAEASEAVREAILLAEAGAIDTEITDAQAEAPPGVASGSATTSQILQQIQGVRPPFPEGSGPDQDDINPPPGMMELRPGAPGDVQAGLLFVVDPPDTALLVGWVDDPGGSPGSYREVIEIAAGRLTVAHPPAGTPPPDAFLTYNAESFLDEFFPGEETEVEIGAGALVARHRAHTLAEARQRLKLTQAHVAERMNVRQERVSAIERAEPGATEVRTLAAYVRALGGRLEITADLGGERIVLR